MLCAIPDHHPAIRTHGRNDVGVLWLIASLVHLPLVVNLLDDVELDFHGRLLRATAIAANLTLVLIIVVGVRGIGIRKLDMGNLEVVLRVACGVGADEQTMSGVGLVRNTMREGPVRILRDQRRLGSELLTLAHQAATEW